MYPVAWKHSLSMPSRPINSSSAWFTFSDNFNFASKRLHAVIFSSPSSSMGLHHADDRRDVRVHLQHFAPLSKL